MTHQLCPATLRYFSRFIKGENILLPFPREGRDGFIKIRKIPLIPVVLSGNPQNPLLSTFFLRLLPPLTKEGGGGFLNPPLLKGEYFV